MYSLNCISKINCGHYVLSYCKTKYNEIFTPWTKYIRSWHFFKQQKLAFFLIGAVLFCGKNIVFKSNILIPLIMLRFIWKKLMNHVYLSQETIKAYQIQTRGPGALYRVQEYHCNLVLFFF